MNLLENLVTVTVPEPETVSGELQGRRIDAKWKEMTASFIGTLSEQGSHSGILVSFSMSRCVYEVEKRAEGIGNDARWAAGELGGSKTGGTGSAWGAPKTMVVNYESMISRTETGGRTRPPPEELASGQDKYADSRQWSPMTTFTKDNKECRLA